MKRDRVLITILVCLVVFLQSCDRTTSEEPVRIALLPVVDTLPLHVAQREGLFEQQGVRVEAIPVSSPVERDQLFQAGEVDGMLNELTTSAVFAATGIMTVLTVRVPYANQPMFRILATPNREITKPADLASLEIGVSMNTVIEYVTARMLVAEGVRDVQMASVPVIAERFQLLLAGDIPAATLPEPLAAAAVAAGAVPIMDDARHPMFSMSVLSFDPEVARGSVQAIVDAWNEGARLINEDPEAYRAVLLEAIPVPASVESTYRIPRFPVNLVPTPAQWDDAVEWLMDKNIINARPPTSVTGRFVE